MEKKFKIRKDDTVQVIAGKDKGKRGAVVRVIAKKDAVIVSGVNMVKKAMRKRSQQDQGGIACKKCGPTKIGFKIDGDKKTRVCRKCGEAL